MFIHQKRKGKLVDCLFYIGDGLVEATYLQESEKNPKRFEIKISDHNQISN